MTRDARLDRAASLILSALALYACNGSGVTTPPPPPPTVAAVNVTPPAASVATGGTTQLTATPVDATGTPVSGQSVNWSSANAGIATVSNTGLVTGVAPGGPVTITATIAGKSGSAAITVTPPPVATVAVSPGGSSIALGATAQLAAIVKDAGGNTLVGRAVTWTTSNATIATVSSSGLVTAAAVGGPVTITATSEGVNGTATFTVIRPRFGAWTLERQITITTGAAAAPAGYSIPIQIDHASLVTAGKALSGGNDVRIAYWNGTAWVELDRVLDAGSAWNSAGTTLWFKTQAAIQANSNDTNYYLFYGNPSGFTPPASPANVFLLSDDFETDNFNKWISSDMGGTNWTIDNSRSHSGTFAATYPAEATGQHAIIANPPLNVADVYFESWWYLTNINPALNVGLELRRASGATDRYEVLTCCNTGTFGWQIDKVINFTHTEVADPAGAIAPNSWLRVGVAMSGTALRVFVNGAQVNSVDGLTDLLSGNIGLEKVTVPAGVGFWIDDVVIRRYASPEPTATVGPESVAP